MQTNEERMQELTRYITERHLVKGNTPPPALTDRLMILLWCKLQRHPHNR